ncbi:hypothetical protein [Paenibacillus sp. LK1]|uniref:hypothetical protein n=1 Tax=Paenibacillus sp. LK1 TaxID=2053014 RepID=UPI000C19634E|nr:hypothetical protein [Paenibacillus sp. LK1]PIH55810.1 hypothetical protein CS562_29930 [Paenibacillus sp. LK1]
MEWVEVKTIEDLKKLGSFNEVKREMANILGESVLIKGKGWNDLFHTLLSLRKASKKMGNQSHTDNLESTYTNEIDFFKSDIDQLIFYILKLDGDTRLKYLGISEFFYKNKEIATRWRNRMIKKLHPDICKHPLASEATSEVNKLYEGMKQGGRTRQTTNTN